MRHIGENPLFFRRNGTLRSLLQTKQGEPNKLAVVAIKHLRTDQGRRQYRENFDTSLWPNFHHSPQDPDAASRYYFNQAGEVIPTPERIREIATRLLEPIYNPRNGKKKPTNKKLTLMYNGNQPGSRAIYDATIAIARNRYGVTEIQEIDRTPATEKRRLTILQALRERADYLEAEGKTQEAERVKNRRSKYLQIIEKKEFEGVSGVAGHIGITETNPHEFDEFSEIDRADLNHARVKAANVRIGYKITWNLTSFPHKNTAIEDVSINHPREITHELEVNEWLQATERPLKEVLDAQKKLVSIMNRARQIRVIANPNTDYQTDITFKTTRTLASGKEVPRRWFNHAGFEYNFPGSEVFGAPARESGNGTIAYPYPVMFDGVLLPNLVIHLENGRVKDDWNSYIPTLDDKGQPLTAEKREAYIKAIAHFERKMNDESNPGNRFIGEIGIGTSPFPTFNTTDIGFNEKRTGVHFALGRCYANTQKDEAGNPADLDNGNRELNGTFISDIHADLVLPGSDQNPVDMWIDIGTAGRENWILIQRNGAFVKKVRNNMYAENQNLTILNAVEAKTNSFSANFPPAASKVY